MALQTLDWFIIIIFLIFILVTGSLLTRRASQNVESFFLGSRQLPWWLAGTSMVATTFAADTPLLVTELVAENGISGNWLWWNGLMGGMLAAFLFAHLWRKAGIITDVELTELRYSGRAAAFLRGFKAIYLGIFMNAVIIAWVNVALGALLQVFFAIPADVVIYYVAAAMIFVVIYASLAGLWGVAATDFIQFIVAMSGCIVLAVIVVNTVGGIEGLHAQLPRQTLDFLPTFEWSTTTLVATGQTLSISLATFFAFVGIQWWASWYPGAEPGGGGYIAQRMMSVPDSQQAVKATVLFQIAHYALRPWPWILVALASLVLYPELATEDKKLGYVMAMRDFLPPGLKGLLLVAFLAAYMSTVSTQLNWGSSYIINDVYQRFIRPQAQQRQLVTAARITTLILMLFALVVTAQIQTLESAFKFMIECGAGLGAVLILRWYWWRINAWSEITAMITPFIVYSVVKFYSGLDFPYSLFITVSITTIIWLVVTLMTPPTDSKVLQAFYQRVHPPGFWHPVATTTQPTRLAALLACWVFGVGLGYACLLGIGYLIFGHWLEGGICGLIAVGCSFGIYRFMQNSSLYTT
ncbi:MAG: sodium:solute symporter family protein [Pseudomonadota bacterium]|nr:sodium:solute symporter family protein [Pseudomonadota bacterium]